MSLGRSIASMRRKCVSLSINTFPARRGFHALRLPKAAPRSYVDLPADEPIEEETLLHYVPTHRFPVNPGDVLDGRYEITAKLGWGSASTVWLARDLKRWRWQTERYVAVKINNCDRMIQTAAERELEMSRRLKRGDRRHRGSRFVRELLDNFHVSGPHGEHVCLVYEPMRESLSLLQERFPNKRLPLDSVKATLRMILMGLDYIHSECKMVHTDLKPDNILLSIESAEVLEEFVQAHRIEICPRKVSGGCSSSPGSPLMEGIATQYTYYSSPDLGHLRSPKVYPRISDFGCAQMHDQFRLLPIQPDVYRAPEVLLGIQWSYSADIWNLAIMLWTLLETKDPFTSRLYPGGVYSAAAHLAEMIALLGPPPQALITGRAKDARDWRWDPGFENPERKMSNSIEDFYGGPFWDYDTGEFLHQDLIPRDLRLEDSLPSVSDGKEKEEFLDFARTMLQWVPEHRKTASELLEHPWLAPPG